MPLLKLIDRFICDTLQSSKRTAVNRYRNKRMGKRHRGNRFPLDESAMFTKLPAQTKDNTQD